MCVGDLLTFVEGDVLEDPIVPLRQHLAFSTLATGLLAEFDIPVLNVLPPVLQMDKGDVEFLSLLVPCSPLPVVVLGAAEPQVRVGLEPLDEVRLLMVRDAPAKLLPLERPLSPRTLCWRLRIIHLRLVLFFQTVL